MMGKANFSDSFKEGVVTQITERGYAPPSPAARNRR